MKRQYPWCVVGHWKGDPGIPVQQVYGPFTSRRAAMIWIKQHKEPSWRWQAFYLHETHRDMEGANETAS